MPISLAFDLARLGFEAWMVIGLRTAKLAMGGPAAMLEAQRMVAEKTVAIAGGPSRRGDGGVDREQQGGCRPKGDRALSPSREGKSSQADTQGVSVLRKSPPPAPSTLLFGRGYSSSPAAYERAVTLVPSRRR